MVVPLFDGFDQARYCSVEFKPGFVAGALIVALMPVDRVYECREVRNRFVAKRDSVLNVSAWTGDTLDRRFVFETKTTPSSDRAVDVRSRLFFRIGSLDVFPFD